MSHQIENMNLLEKALFTYTDSLPCRLCKLQLLPRSEMSKLTTIIHRAMRGTFRLLPLGPQQLIDTSHSRLFSSTLSHSFRVEHVEVSKMHTAENLDDVAQIHKGLQETGIIKVSLHFPDPNSDYLRQLVRSLHQHYGHQSAITHSDSRGEFWDVRPRSCNIQLGAKPARSETVNEFPWHTDCSYEPRPPKFFALHVIQHDRHGGGTLSLINVNRLLTYISPKSIAALSRPEYSIRVPEEFYKDQNPRFIVGSIVAADQGSGVMLMRFRKDLISALTPRALDALGELDHVLQDASVQSSLGLRLLADDLPKSSIIIIDNWRWLHARSHINDVGRHLRRIRWNALPFGNEKA